MSSNASLAPQAKPGCPDKHRAIVERHLASFPPSWRLAPQNGEIFDSLEVVEDRIRAWSFCDGFDVVRSGGVARDLLAHVSSASTTVPRLEMIGTLRNVWKRMMKVRLLTSVSEIICKRLAATVS